jgi:hypothetical protein
VHRALRQRNPGPDLRLFVVWVPKLRGLEEAVPTATTFVPDPQGRHYWDRRGVIMKQYRDVLQLSEDAWDMFLIFAPDARWEGTRPPAPHYWMHQLGSPRRPRVNGPFLDANVFAERVAALEAERKRPAVSRSGALGVRASE